jgi:CRP-like cAMP-binding protein
MNNAIEVLNKMKKMNTALMLRLYNSLIRKEVKAKDYLVWENEVPNDIYFVESGMFESYFEEEPSGRRIYTDFWPANSIIFDCQNLWNQTKSDHYVIALDKSVVYTLPYAEMMAICKSFSSFYFYIQNLWAIRNDEMQRRALILSAANTDERYLRFVKYFGDMVYQIPMKHLSEYLCMSLASLHRIITLQRESKKTKSGNGINLSVRHEGFTGRTCLSVPDKAF